MTEAEAKRLALLVAPADDPSARFADQIEAHAQGRGQDLEHEQLPLVSEESRPALSKEWADARARRAQLVLRRIEDAPKSAHAATAAPKPLAKILAIARPLTSPQSLPSPQADEPPPRKAPVSFQHSKSPNGIATSFANAIIALNELNLDCRYDEFHDKLVVTGHSFGLGSGTPLDNIDNISLKARQTVLELFGFDPGKQFTIDAIRSRCLDNIFDPVRDYLDGLQWDGEARIDTWLTDYCGVEDTELNRAIGRKMLIAGVRRVRSPGCKFDYIVVIEGDQGAGKSTLLRILAGQENFTDAEILAYEKREQQEATQGVWIYEIGELQGMDKATVSKIKLFASKTHDSARPAYGYVKVDRPRRCIFVATTNDDKYLRDTTGNRRFWPVTVPEGTRINLNAVAADRDQLWAEANAAEATGEALVIPEALWPDAARAQAARMELDPWEDVLMAKLAQLTRGKAPLDAKFAKASDPTSGEPEWRVASDYLLTEVIGLPKERQFNNHTKRLAAIMRGLGWRYSASTIRIGKFVGRGYVKPAEPPEPPSEGKS